jgi:hypothetical protein
MGRKKKNRFTVEYLGKVENCGSREMALARMKHLRESHPFKMHITVYHNGTWIAECMPLRYSEEVIEDDC